MPERTVTIPEEDYEELLRESSLLTALIQAGVEDWEGYEVAQEILDNNEDEEEEEEEYEDEEELEDE